MKKILSLLLVLATVLSCFVLTVSAEETVVSDEGRLPFEDVKESHWFTPYIKFCYANGIIKGMTEYTVAPNGTLTRAQFVTMLANLEGVDTSSYTVDKFTDVKSNHWYYGAVAWAYNEGVVNGMSDTTFQPNGVLTRAQLSVVMNNYMKDKYAVELDETALDGFSDKPKVEYWYYDAMVFSVSAGLLSGNSNGTLAATGNVTRAQAAVIFEAFMKNYFYAACDHNFSEATCTEASVCPVCGLVNGYALGHSLYAYDCVTGGKCITCEADVEPSDILHSFTLATCTAPRTCRDCGATRGEANGHKWIAATCTAPKTCGECNTVEGKALGHTTSNGICGRCKKEFFPSPSHKVIYYLKSKGEYVPESDAYVYSVVHSNSITFLGYSSARGSLILENYYYYENGDIEAVIMDMPFYDHIYTFEYGYFSGGDSLSFWGAGSLDAYTLTKNTKEGFSSYEGNYQQLYTDNLNEAFYEMITDANTILKQLCGMSIRDIDFKVY